MSKVKKRQLKFRVGQKVLVVARIRYLGPAIARVEMEYCDQSCIVWQDSLRPLTRREAGL